MKILIMGVEEAETFVGGAGDVCISIRSPEAQPAQLRGEWRAILRLYFHDLGFLEPGKRLPQGAVPPTDAMCAEIAGFAVEHRDAERMVVHCEAGISRSVAVALAIGSKLTRSWPFPRWYRKEWRRARFVHYRTLFEAVQAALDKRLAL